MLLPNPPTPGFLSFFPLKWNLASLAGHEITWTPGLIGAAGMASMMPVLQLAGPRHTISCYQKLHSLPPSLFRRNETHGVSANICTQRTTQTRAMLSFCFSRPLHWEFCKGFQARRSLQEAPSATCTAYKHLNILPHPILYWCICPQVPHTHTSNRRANRLMHCPSRTKQIIRFFFYFINH